MRLKCVNITTVQPVVMREFYAAVFASPWREIVPGRWEIDAGGVVIALLQSETPAAVQNDCSGLEFSVEDVDAEYRRLSALGIATEGEPVTYPWKYRCFGFKDPDGNGLYFVQYVG